MAKPSKKTIDEKLRIVLAVLSGEFSAAEVARLTAERRRRAVSAQLEARAH